MAISPPCKRLSSQHRFFVCANVSSHGWRSVFWLSTALSVFATLLLIIGLPETKYHRVQDAPPTLTSEAANLDTKTPALDNVAEKYSLPTPETASDTPSTRVGQGRPDRSQFAPFQKADKRWKQFVVRDIFTPIRVFFNP